MQQCLYPSGKQYRPHEVPDADDPSSEFDEMSDNDRDSDDNVIVIGSTQGESRQRSPESLFESILCKQAHFKDFISYNQSNGETRYRLAL